MLLTYDSMVKPVFSYGSAVWMPNISKTNLDKIQVTQNHDLHIVTGCHQGTSIDHLHAECEVLPVKPRLDMLCRQFRISVLRPAHPNHNVVRHPPGPRKMKEMLASKYLHSVDK
jgi:hypothetical protein